jgi:hypothetical protein
MAPKARFQINISLSEEEIRPLEAAAIRAGDSMAEYLRTAMKEKLARDAKKGSK